MRILLLGGPFNFRTMELPPNHAGSVYLPIPLTFEAIVVAEAEEATYAIDPDFKVAEYVPGEDIVGHDPIKQLPVFHGRIYDWLVTE